MKGQRGIGVIEMMVGIGLMAIGILGMSTLAITVTRGNLSGRLIDDATRLGQQKVEQIKRNGYAAAASGTIVETGLNAAGSPSGPFQRTTVIAAGGLPNTRTVTVTMQWTDYGTRQSTFFTELSQ